MMAWAIRLRDPTLRLLIATPLFWGDPAYWWGAFTHERLDKPEFWANTWSYYLAAVVYGAFVNEGEYHGES